MSKIIILGVLIQTVLARIIKNNLNQSFNQSRFYVALFIFIVVCSLKTCIAIN